jgi:hypothetical protein
LVGGIVPRGDFALPNGDEKRHSEAAFRSGNRNGNGNGKKQEGVRGPLLRTED